MLTYKTKHNVLTSLHELTKQNTLQKGRSFCEIAKNSAQVYCFKKFIWVGNFPQQLIGGRVGIRISWVEKKIEKLISERGSGGDIY